MAEPKPPLPGEPDGRAATEPSGGLDTPVPGVRALEHTADVGLEVEATALPELFRRAALGTMWLVFDRTPAVAGEAMERRVELAEGEPADLLRSWLRALLGLEEVEGFAVTDARITILPFPHCSAEGGTGLRLEGWVEGGEPAYPPVREIKGVTLHGLRVEEVEGGWRGRVIFDV